MVQRPIGISGTPFKSVSIVAARRGNRQLREMSAGARSSQQRIALRDIRDRIDARNLPARRAGAVE